MTSLLPLPLANPCPPTLCSRGTHHMARFQNPSRPEHLLGAAVHAHLTLQKPPFWGSCFHPSPSLHCPHNNQRNPGKTNVRSCLSCSEPSRSSSSPEKKSPHLHRGQEGSTPALLLPDPLSSSSLAFSHPPTSLPSAVTHTGQTRFCLRALAPAVLSAWNALPQISA